MLASRTVFSSVARIDRLALDTVVGSALEVAIHSIEGLRDRLVRRALLRAMRAMTTAQTT
jgi:hypothetical protein